MRMIGWMVTLALSGLGSSLSLAGPQEMPDLGSATQAETFDVIPPAGHHFNVQAPAKVRAAAAVLPFKLSEAKLSVPLQTVGHYQELTVEVYVCDDAKTFCKKRKQSFRVAGTATGSEPGTAKAKASQPSGSNAAKPHLEKDTGFYVNDPKTAFDLAARKKLPMMIDFFGIWCPPCNHLDAMVFRSKAFKAKSGSRFVKLKLDADRDQFNALKNRYRIQGLPTVVFTTPAGDEISRLVGYHPLEEFVAKAEAAYRNKNEGYAEIEALASGGNAEARYKAAKIALDRDEPVKALEWMAPLKELLAATHDPRIQTFYEAQVGAASASGDKKLARKTLEQWLKEYPESPATLEHYETLADLQQEAGDPSGAQATIEGAVALTGKLLEAPAKLKGSSYSSADVAQQRAILLDRAGDKVQAKEAYLVCADAYAKEAKAEGTTYPRGPNLERAYCLGKGGQIQQSEALYREGIRRFPKEYTFYQGLAKLWLESGQQPAKALPEAVKALKHAYGNQRLKAMMTLVRVHEALGHLPQAIGLIDAELGAPVASDAAPGTLKLREKLRAKAEELRKKGPART